MKVERLYAITVYLLNHGLTSANELAKHFEVSLRTIQRDIDSLCIAGIPVVSLAGANGGYEIAEKYKLDNHFATSDDYSYILAALKGFVSATADANAAHTLENITQLHEQQNQSIILDFSVLREGEQQTLQTLQSAIAKKRMVSFIYTNNDNETRTHKVEPVAVVYRWYAWYLLAWSNVKKDYRNYKLVRMSNLKITDEPLTKQHESAEIILKKAEKTDSRKYTELLLKCKPEAKARVHEYLKATAVKELADGGALMKLTVVENEQLWLGTLLSLGNAVEVLEPPEIRTRLKEAAEKILALYKA